jgi:hypothetical protein
VNREVWAEWVPGARFPREGDGRITGLSSFQHVPRDAELATGGSGMGRDLRTSLRRGEIIEGIISCVRWYQMELGE